MRRVDDPPGPELRLASSDSPYAGAHVVVRRASERNGSVNELQITEQPTQGTIVDECRRIGELLRLDAVGVMSRADGRRRVAWWAAPGSPALPPRLDDVISRKVEGWIVARVDGDAFVFARR